jgi:hypothetical protein
MATYIPQDATGVLISDISKGAQTNDVKVAQATGTNLHTVVDSGVITVSGTVTASGPLTDAQLRATPVPVSGTVTSADASLDGTTLVDNAAFTDETTRVQMAGYVFDDVAGTALTENDAAAARIDAKRAQMCVIEDGTTRGRTALVTSGKALTVSIGQITGATVLAGNGVTGTGSQRVTIASDNTAFAVNAALTAGAALVGKVGLDQTTPGTTNAVSLAQIGATTVSTGNGVVGAGVQRVAIASDNTPFQVAASNETGTIYQGTTAKTPADIVANIAASQTDSVLLAAQGASNKIRVLQVVAVAGTSATNLTFNTKGAGAGTAISCLFANAANGGIVLPFSPNGWFTTNANEALTVTTGAGSTTGILIKYIVVT